MSAHEHTSVEGRTSNKVEMDQMYRFQRHIYDASRRFYLLGRERLIADLNVPAGGTVLEIGCGTGRNLVKVAQAYPEARIFGIDISDEMLKTAANSIWKAGLTDRVRIAQGDAIAADPLPMFGVRSFDRIFFSYALSMIPSWSVALSHAVKSLCPEGELRIIDFGQCENLPRSLKVLLFQWLRRFNVEPRAAIMSEVTQLALQSGRSCSFNSEYRGYSWHISLGSSRGSVDVSAG